MPTQTAGVFLRIDSQFWHERRSGIRDDGMLYDVDKGKLVSDEIDESTFCVFEECVRAWLIRRKIDESNPAFPDALRKRPAALPIRMPSDEVIRAQMLKLIASGLTRDEAAKRICKIPGFEMVGNAHARRTVNGFLKPGRRPKQSQ